MVTKKKASKKKASKKKAIAGEFIPRDVQVDCAKFMLERPASGAFLDVGEGKTAITCMVATALRAKKMFHGMIVITTMEIVDHDVWPKDIKKWGFDFTHTILHGKDKDKNLKKDVDIYIMNLEGLPWLLKNIKYLKAKMLVLDESSKAKGFNTNRFKIFKKIIHKFNRRHLLDATPNTQGYMDLFSQIYILDEGERLGRYITAFRNTYFTPVGYKGYQYILQDDGAARIHKKLEDIIYRPEENSVKLPPPKYNDIILKLPKAIRKKYDELEEEFILEEKKGVITAINAAVKRGKLKQFCNGSVYGEDRKVINIHKLKINAAKKIVAGLKGSPILIGYEFKHDLEALLKAFPDAPYFGTSLKGKKPTKTDKLRIEKAWNMGKIPVLLGQISSVARGLNLQESGHNIMNYSHIDKFSDVIQFLGRVRRSGQKMRVNVWRLIIENSVDEDVLLSNKNKDTTQKGFLNAMKKRLKKRK